MMVSEDVPARGHSVEQCIAAVNEMGEHVQRYAVVLTAITFIAMEMEMETVQNLNSVDVFCLGHVDVRNQDV